MPKYNSLTKNNVFCLIRIQTTMLLTYSGFKLTIRRIRDRNKTKLGGFGTILNHV